MKIGMRSYCLDREIEQGRMTLLECIDWAARQGADCLELVPFAFRFDDPATGKIDASLIKSVRRRAQDAGVELVNYSILADLCREGDALAAEKARIRNKAEGNRARMPSRGHCRRAGRAAHAPRRDRLPPAAGAEHADRF